MSQQASLDTNEKQLAKDPLSDVNLHAEPVRSLEDEIDEKALQRVIRKVSFVAIGVTARWGALTM